MDVCTWIGVLGGIGFLVFTAVVAGEGYYYQRDIATGLQTDLAFLHGKQYGPGIFREYLTIGAVEPDGVFARAGFRAGDILAGYSITGLY